MIRKFKAFGLTLLAVMALGAVAAQAASAHKFHSEEASTNLTGTGTGVFTIAGFEISCSNAVFSGSQAGATTETVTVHPTYNNTENTCEASIGNATVHTEGCNYKFSSVTGPSGHAPVEVVCETGKEITITSAGCVIHVPGQTTGGGVTYHNEGSGATRDIKVTATVTGITATGTHSFGCTLAGKVGHLTEGTYTETATVKGYKAGSKHATKDHVGVWVE